MNVSLVHTRDVEDTERSECTQKIYSLRLIIFLVIPRFARDAQKL